MKHLRILYAVLFFSVSAFGQHKTISGDTAFWYNAQYKLAQKIGLHPTLESMDSFYLRFWTPTSAVDIWTSKGVYYNAAVTSFTKSAEDYNPQTHKRKTSTYYKQQFLFDTATARIAYELAKSVNKIPSEAAIKNWKPILDGNEYIFEVSTPTTFSFKHFDTPTAQDTSVIEARQISSYVRSLASLLNLRTHNNEFFNTLKPGKYDCGAFIETKFTPKQIALLRKLEPYQHYLDSVTPQLDKFFSDTLTKIFLKVGVPDCDARFLLHFNPENQLLKVVADEKYADKEEKGACKNCSTKISVALKNVRATFVHPQISYWKMLTFENGKVLIR